MQHPVLKNLRSVVIYGIIWLIIIVTNIFVFHHNYNFSLSECIVTSFIFNTLLAIFGIAIWYAVLYSFPEKVGITNLIINHVTAAVAMVFVVNASGLFLIRIFTNERLYDFVLDHIFGFSGTGLSFYSLFVLIYYIIIYNNNLKEKKKNEDRLLAMVKEAELNLLKSQINPHFLFNSLNSISSLTITNPAKAQEMIIKLSDFLRYSISRNDNQKSSLRLELENIQRYLDIEKVRFGSKLNYESIINETCFKCTLPAMILQPLFENAIKHGVYESTETITVKASCSVDKGFLTFILTNNFDLDSPSKRGEGIGLKNIRERLRLTYHRDGLMQIQKTNNTFEVKLIIPQVD